MAPAEPGAGKTTVGTLPAVLRRRLANLLDRGVEVCSQEDQQWLCLILFAPADEIVPLPCQQNGRAHVCTPVTNAHLVSRLLLETKKLNRKHKHNVFTTPH